MNSKILVALVVFVGIVGLTGCKPEETEYARYNREANEEMLKYCTNNIQANDLPLRIRPAHLNRPELVLWVMIIMLLVKFAIILFGS
jgi:hypothetical protein